MWVGFLEFLRSVWVGLDVGSAVVLGPPITYASEGPLQIITHGNTLRHIHNIDEVVGCQSRPDAEHEDANEVGVHWLGEDAKTVGGTKKQKNT